MSSKGGIIIESKVLKLKKLVESDDKEIIKKILNDMLDLNIDEIKYDKNIQLNNMSEYEFELINEIKTKRRKPQKYTITTKFTLRNT